MDDTISAMLVGILPFIPFFLALMFGVFGNRAVAPPSSRKIAAWSAAGAALAGVAVVLVCLILQHELTEPLSPAPPRVPAPVQVPKPVPVQPGGE